MPDETIVGYLVASAEERQGRAFCYRPDGSSTSHGDALARIAAIVEWLEVLEIGRGDPVPCYLDLADPIPGIHIMLACAAVRAVPVPLSPVFSSDYFMRAIVHRLGAKVVFTTRKHVGRLCGHGVRVLCFDERTRDEGEVSTLGDDVSIPSDRAIECLTNRATTLRADDIFMIQPTAGSTGTPKLVLRRHCAFTRYARFIGDELAAGSNGQDRFLMVAALTHAFGLHMLTTCLRLGAAMAIPTSLDTAVSLDEVRILDPTILPLVPRVQAALHRQASRRAGQRPFGPSARIVCSAGGSADRQILETFARQGVEILEFYGSSEASVVAVTPRGAWRPPFAGRLVPDVDARVGSDGELLVKSPGVTDGYVDDDAATRCAFENGYYKTGDFGEIAADGFLRILGRKSDVFNTPEGSNIHPRRIEEMIELEPWVDQVVLVGDQRPYVAALIVLSPAFCPTSVRGLRTTPLDPAVHREVYREAAAAIAEINSGQERIEHVVRFALFGEKFEDDVYAIVGGCKVRRNRKALAEKYGRVIDLLYAQADTGDATLVAKKTESSLLQKTNSRHELSWKELQ